jgi:hypothetical protein
MTSNWCSRDGVPNLSGDGAQLCFSCASAELCACCPPTAPQGGALIDLQIARAGQGSVIADWFAVLRQLVGGRCV